MRVLVFSGVDNGGQGYQLARALSGQGWPSTAVRRHDARFRYPGQVTWSKRDPGVLRLVAKSDVIHLMQVPALLRLLGRTTGKQIVVHHLGTYFRQSPNSVSAACRAIGAMEVAGDYGLLTLALRAQLLPVVVDAELMAGLRAEHYVQGDRVRIFHSPSDRRLKQTDLLIAAVTRLARRYAVELQIVEGVPWAECIRRKASADIVFDQVEYGYGLNSVEAMAMAIPVVAGIADPAARSMMLDAWGELPFVEATPETIEAALEPLVADSAHRRRVGRAGRLHVERIHTPFAVARRYQSLLGQAAAA